MTTNRRTIELDPATDASLRALAVQRGQDEAAILDEAIALGLHELSAPSLRDRSRKPNWDDFFSRPVESDFLIGRRQPTAKEARKANSQAVARMVRDTPCDVTSSRILHT